MDRATLAVCSLFGFAIAGVLAYGGFTKPNFSKWITFAPAVLFGVLAILCGCRVFAPREWYVAREARLQNSISRYPKLSLFLLTLGTFGFAWKVIRLIREIPMLISR